MTVQTRQTLKGYFDNGDTITASAMADLVDSFIHLSDTTAQSLNSDLAVPNLVATNISANNVGVAGKITASAATFTGAVRQGVSAAASAADSRGYFLVVQEATVTNATVQVAFLPSTSNIVSLGVKVLVGGSAGAGGLNVAVGDSNDHLRFAKIGVSAVGLYEFTNVSALRLAAVSGRVEMIASGASAGTNIVGFVKYFQRA